MALASAPGAHDDDVYDSDGDDAGGDGEPGGGAPRGVPASTETVAAVAVAASVETNHWFGSARATLKLVSLAQNEVVLAGFLDQ